jgi:hypothetical protein
VNLTAVQDEMAARLKTVEGLRVPVRGSGKVAPPAAMFLLPEQIKYDTSYRRGADGWVQEITVLVGKRDDATAWKTLHEFVAGSGPRSIKAALDSTPMNPYTSCDTVVVTECTLGSATVSTVDYVGATFSATVMGPGAD